MKANELRIGNIVLFNGHETELTIDEFHNWLHADADEERYSGIHDFGPKLITAGYSFERKFDDLFNEYYEEYIYDKIHDFKIRLEIRPQYSVWNFFIDDIMVSTPEYLHEVQNIFFYLTGKELQLKSK